MFGNGLFFRLSLGQTDYPIPLIPLAAFAEQINTLKALENCSVFATGGSAGFEAVMLRHGVSKWMKSERTT